MQQMHDFVCITKFNHINFQVKIYILFLVLERGSVLFQGVGVGGGGGVCVGGGVAVIT